MFKKYHSVTMLDSKWNPIAYNIKLEVIPRINEFVYMDNQYYQVVNVIHQIEKIKIPNIFVIINKIELSDNKEDKKL